MICSVVDDYLWAREHGLDMTGSYLRSPLVAVTTKHGNGEIIALPEGYWFSREIAKDNPGRTIKYYVTFENCFDALLSGQACLLYTSMPVRVSHRGEPVCGERFSPGSVSPAAGGTGQYQKSKKILESF